MSSPSTLLGAPRAPKAVAKSRRDLLTMMVWAAVILGGLLSGGAVFNRLSSATDPAPTSESQQARRSLETITAEQGTILAVVTDTPNETVEQLASRLRRVQGVSRVRTSADNQLPQPLGGGVTLAVGLEAG